MLGTIFEALGDQGGLGTSLDWVAESAVHRRACTVGGTEQVTAWRSHKSNQIIVFCVFPVRLKSTFPI